MSPYTVTHLWEHFSNGVHSLAHGERPLRERFVPAVQQVMMRFRNPEGFDPILRPTWFAICKLCSTHQDPELGSIEASIRAMSDEDLRWAVDAFVDMANWIERKIPDELADAIMSEKHIPSHLLEN
jgi:hypothetical protein